MVTVALSCRKTTTIDYQASRDLTGQKLAAIAFASLLSFFPSRCSSMAEQLFCKQKTRVRFSASAPKEKETFMKLEKLAPHRGWILTTYFFELTWKGLDYWLIGHLRVRMTYFPRKDYLEKWYNYPIMHPRLYIFKLLNINEGERYPLWLEKLFQLLHI